MEIRRIENPEMWKLPPGKVLVLVVVLLLLCFYFFVLFYLDRHTRRRILKLINQREDTPKAVTNAITKKYRVDDRQ